MTTCTWNFRRHALRAVAAASVLVAGGGLSIAQATADQLSSLQGQAQGVADQIQSLGHQEAALGEQFDAARIGVQAADARVAAAAAQLAAADASAAQARTALGKEALDAYTGGGTSHPLGSGTLGSATSSLLGAEYVDSMAASQRDSLDQYRLAGVQARTAKAQLQQAQSAAQAQVATLARSRQSVQATEGKLQAVYQQDKGQIATLVAKIQAEREAAAAKAAAAKAAADQAAAQHAAALQASARQAAAQQGAAQQGSAARASTNTPAAPAPASGAPSFAPPAARVDPAPPPGHGASGAVAAALTRVGDPYVWGAAGPSSFDCSGLVAWSYAQVGVSLPHYSGAQYNDGVHISMSQLQPGDLVFPANPGDHVAMYIGGGQIVEAPYTGANVHVVAMGSWFVSAVRIA